MYGSILSFLSKLRRYALPPSTPPPPTTLPEERRSSRDVPKEPHELLAEALHGSMHEMKRELVRLSDRVERAGSSGGGKLQIDQVRAVRAAAH